MVKKWKREDDNLWCPESDDRLSFSLSLSLSLSLSTHLGDDLLGASDEIRAKLAGEYEKIARMYGAESGGMDEFPTFAFEEPLLEALATDHVADLKTALTS